MEEEPFQVYFTLITESVKPSLILQSLLKEDFPGLREKCTELVIEESKDPVKASISLFDFIFHCKCDAKYKKLIAALKLSDEYEDLGQLCEGFEDVYDTEKLTVLITNFYNEIKEIDPENLLHDAQRQYILSKYDSSFILKLKKQKGNLRGTITFIDRIARNDSNWFISLVNILYKQQYRSLSRKLEEAVQTHEKVTEINYGDGNIVTTPNKLSLVDREESPERFEGASSYDEVEIQRGIEQSLLRKKYCDNGAAMDSDEEESMIKEAIKLSMQGHSQTTQSTIPCKSTQHPTVMDCDQETLPKRSLQTEKSGLVKSQLVKYSTVQNPKYPKLDDNHGERNEFKPSMNIPIKSDVQRKDVKPCQENLPTSNHHLSMSEMREKRLARFDNKSAVHQQSVSNNLDVQNSESIIPDKQSNVIVQEINTKDSVSSRGLDSLNLTEHDHFYDRPVTTASASSNFDSDRALALSLQEEEDKIASRLLSSISDNNVTQGANGNGKDNTRLWDNMFQPEQEWKEQNTYDENQENVPVQDLELRSYQLELTERANKGQNTIIVAPTGSGKTHVALGISKYHMENAEFGENPKIVFIVPTTALVDQQKRQYETFLKKYQSYGISGEINSSQKISIALMYDHYDIFIVTPAILINALKSKDLDSLGKFSLIIFDECHHTSKVHPYNQLMDFYFQDKKSKKKLPQIVGLTASPGVGKADRTETAVTHILTLCANLDARICTVRQNIAELKKNVNNPNEITIEVYGRIQDPFRETIKEIMKKIEFMVLHCTTNKYQDEDESFNKFERNLAAPAFQGSDRYTQWISTLENILEEILDQDIRRTVHPCLKHLRIYNNAIMLNDDCRTEDALNYLKKEFEEIQWILRKEHKIDNQLYDFYNEKQEKLIRFSANNRNPKLKRLHDVIVQYFREKPDSRGIIFCKTRELTTALVNWIESEKEMKHLSPRKVVGSHSPGTKGGMTQNMIEDVLKLFKQGEHKIIVATTVAEEGLDVSKCNLVIRYDFVTNETARIQSKGRGRAEDALYILFAQKGSGIAEKEKLLKMREALMHKAMEKISDMSDVDFEHRINELQAKIQIDKQMRNLGSERKTVKSSDQNGDFQLRCLKCDTFVCFSGSVKRIEQSHHIVTDPHFEAKVKVIRIPEPKTFKGFEQNGKLFCKICHNDWGQQARYMNNMCHVIKASGFLIKGPNGRRGVFRKWKEVPFQVKELTIEEFKELIPGTLEESSESSDEF